MSRGALENVTGLFHFGAEFRRVRDVAVVDERDASPFAAHENGLAFERACARCAVTHVADACGSGKFVEVVLAEERGRPVPWTCGRGPFRRWKSRCPRFPGRGAAGHRDPSLHFFATFSPVVNTDDAAFFVYFDPP